MVLVLRIPYPTKFILVTVYLLTVSVVYTCIITIPYREHMSQINAAVGIGPFLTVLCAYILLKLRVSKEGQQ